LSTFWAHVLKKGSINSEKFVFIFDYKLSKVAKIYLIS